VDFQWIFVLNLAVEQKPCFHIYLSDSRARGCDLLRVLIISSVMYGIHVFGCRMPYTPYLYIQVNLYIRS
jgi:hypothetical protein